MTVHPTAFVSALAHLADNVEVGAFAVVHDNVKLGAGTRVGSHCSIGEPTPLAEGRPLVVGANALIRSHSVLYEGSTFGPQLETGHHVTMREGLVAGQGLRVGTGSDLQGDTIIGNHVRLHSSVFIAKSSTIEDFVWIMPYTFLANDPHPPNDGCLLGPHVEQYAVIAAMCFVASGVRIGARSLVAASSAVIHDVEPDMIVRGQPARPVGPTSKVLLRDESGQPAYPWTKHFHRGYPPDVLAAWAVHESA